MIDLRLRSWVLVLRQSITLDETADAEHAP